MKAFMHQLFDYNFYCNKKLIEQCKEMPQVPQKTQELFGHMLNAHHIWNARLLKKEPEFDSWQAQSKEKWEDLHYENQRNSFEIVTNTDNFEQRIDYINSEGRSFSNNIGDILFHIINHSTHHRAQILVDLRSNGIEPQSLDYIFYKR